MAFNSKVSEDGNTLTIFIGGRFDITTYLDFGESYKSNIDSVSSIEIDMKDCEYMDSSALGMMLVLRERFGGDDAKIFITNINPSVKKILLTANFNSLFELA